MGKLYIKYWFVANGAGFCTGFAGAIGFCTGFFICAFIFYLVEWNDQWVGCLDKSK
jgi:hypothetical protein